MPHNEGALSFGILPIDQVHDCGNKLVSKGQLKTKGRVPEKATSISCKNIQKISTLLVRMLNVPQFEVKSADKTQGGS